jgi:hypothetical protein
MRTTLGIDVPILREVKALHESEGRSMGAAYLRIATHPRIFAAPLNPDEALGNVAALVELPHVRVVSEQDGFLDAYKRVAENGLAQYPFALNAILVQLPAIRMRISGPKAER